MADDIPMEVDNSLILSFQGDVPLDLFADGMKHFTAMLEALSKAVAKSAEIEWIIDNLQAGSAITTIVGISDSPWAVAEVIDAYATVGQALAHAQEIPFPPNVRREAMAITELLNGKIKSISFMTPSQEYTVTSRYMEGLQSPQVRYALGAVKGTIETISRRRRHTFMLYDALFDRPVTCYLAPTQEDIMRDAWGKRAVVTGRVGRDPVTGYPVSIRSVVKVEVLSDVDPLAYRKARGALKDAASGESPEDFIRRLRDE